MKGLLKKRKTFPKPKLVLERITTIHGVSLFTRTHGVSLAFWIIITIGNVILTTWFIIVIKRKYESNPVYTRIDSTCTVTQVPFPAVTICNFNMVSLKETANIMRILTHHNKSEGEIKSFLRELPSLKDYRRYEPSKGDFQEIMAILKHHYFTMDIIMEEVHQKCENLLLFCSFNRKAKKCTDIFNLIKTYEGHCCAFNYAALNDANEDPLMPHDEDLEYYDDSDNEHTTGGVIATSESGRSSGLTVVFNVEPNDYPDWSIHPGYGAKILITDPNDYPETSVLYRYVIPGESVDIKVEAQLFQSESDVRRVDVERRECWFHDEATLGHTDRYSFETCNAECKMQSFVLFCGCMPYKYPREKTTRICELKDIPCLRNMTNLGYRKRCEPKCYIECRDKSYLITSDTVPFLKEYYPMNVTKDYNVSELTALQVYYGRSTCNCYKLTLMIDFDRFIATYGGVFSLSFGGSLITLCELTYLLLSYLLALVKHVISILISKVCN